MEPRNQLVAVRETTYIVERAIELVSGVSNPGDYRFWWIGIQRRLAYFDQTGLRHELDLASRFATAHDVHVMRLVLGPGDEFMRQTKIHDMVPRSSPYTSARAT